MSNPTTDETIADVSSSEANTNKFLSFCLGTEEYGVEILCVREIIGVIDITPLPQTPEFIKGVINLRGKIIPVMELRKRFGLDSIEFTEETCIIVIEVTSGDDEQFQMGVIVDTVSEVLDIDPGHIEPAPRFGCKLSTDYIMGMGKTKDKVITILATEKVLTDELFDELRLPTADAVDVAEAA